MVQRVDQNQISHEITPTHLLNWQPNDWAQEIYQDLTGTINEQEEFNKDHAGSKNKFQNNKHNHNDPLQNIEEELQRLKVKRVKSDFGKKESKHFKSTDDEIEQELRSIKNKYKL